METLEFQGYKIYFYKKSVKNIEDFKNNLYGIITSLLLNNERYSLWNSAHIENGAQGHIVFSNRKFNFVLKLSEGRILNYFSIIYHYEFKEEKYELSQYKKLYNDIMKII